VADLTQPWPVAAGSVDLIVCNLVLEHIADLAFIFAEAARCLAPGGRLFVAELHPFKQYQGSKAVYGPAQAPVPIPAFVHHISAFLDAATAAGLPLLSLKEWWHAEDAQAPPRLVSFLFRK
jgi:malonyl-CoA O-methyltransferase